MDLTIHNPPAELLKGLERQASLHKRSIEEEALDILLGTLRGDHRKDAIAGLKAFREELLAKHGGVLFSDSADMIRESRNNDW